jgi:3-oxoadipate enol-lactonase
MEFVDVNGIRLAFERQGSGSPLVLLHGYPLDHSIWLSTAQLLDASFEVFMPDFRGFGQSAPTESTYGVSDLADDVARLLDGFRISKACIAGHSMGGYVALAFANAHSDRLAGLGLISTQALPDPPDRREARYATARQVSQEGVGLISASMSEKLSPAPRVRTFCRDLILRQSREGLIGALKAMAARPDSSALLASLDLPVCIVHGTDDALIPVDRAREMKTALPSAHYLELAGVGHMPMLEAPAATAEALSHLV